MQMTSLTIIEGISDTVKQVVLLLKMTSLTIIEGICDKVKQVVLL